MTVEPWPELAGWTPARVGLGRAGSSLRTVDRLRFQLDAARARDAVRHDLDVDSVVASLRAAGVEAVGVETEAASQQEHLARPDLGRRLAPASHAAVETDVDHDLAVVLAGGLSPGAVAAHGTALALALVARAAATGWRVAPVTVVGDGRVALGDDVGRRQRSAVVVVVIGERPGLSSPRSLGAYVTAAPRVGRTDAERVCVSNIRPGGLEVDVAVEQIVDRVTAALRAGSTGVGVHPRQPRPSQGAPRLGG